MVLPLRSLTAAESIALGHVVADFYSGSTGWVVWSVVPQEHLDESGFFASLFANPVMVRQTPTALEAFWVEGLEFKEVLDDEGVRFFDHLRESAGGGATTEGVGLQLDARVLSPRHRLWLAYFNGEPVATGALFEDDEVSLVKNVSVAPAYRRREFGKAMSAFLVRSCNALPMLDADEGAPSLYAQLGFEIIGEIKFWGRNN